MRTRFEVRFSLAQRLALLQCAAFVAALLCPATGAAQPPRRLKDAARLVVRAVFVAPLKADGSQWDLGGGAAPYQWRQQAALPLGQDSQRQLFEALDQGAPNAMLSKAMPWAVQAMEPGAVAPDVAGAVVLEGTVIKNLPKVQDAYHAMWANEPTDIVAFDNQSRLIVSVRDVDVASDDRIGACVVDGVPMVGADGFISSDSFRCTGQLWAVSIQALPVPEPEVASAFSSGNLPPVLRAMLGRYRVKETVNTMKTIENAIVQWQTESAEACPPGLISLVERKILSKSPKDAWGNYFLFKCPGAHGGEIDLVSAGPDGKFNTADDVNSWQ